MLDVHQVNKIRTLVAQGASQRKVATLLNVSRGSVHNIISGKWDLCRKKRIKKGPWDRRNNCPAKSKEEDVNRYFAKVDPIRCPTCGFLVLPPCVLCGNA